MRRVNNRDRRKGQGLCGGKRGQCALDKTNCVGYTTKILTVNSQGSLVQVGMVLLSLLKQQECQQTALVVQQAEAIRELEMKMRSGTLPTLLVFP